MAKSKFTPALREAIITSLRRGDSMRTAAGLAGISHSQISRWLQRGENEEGTVYRQFYDEAGEAMLEPLARANAVIQRDIVSNPKTAMWYLEHRDLEQAAIGGLDELLGLLWSAARRGNVPAMRMLLEQMGEIAPDREGSVIDELATRRSRTG